jgi:hypothetical protein
MINVSKEKGRREAQKEFKTFKSEFKKVITLNSNLQAQIEAMSSNRLMGGANVSDSKNTDTNLTPSKKSNKPPNYEHFKGIGPNTQQNLKENYMMYLSSSNIDSSQTTKLKATIEQSDSQPVPLINQRDPLNPISHFALSSKVDEEYYSTASNNEIENIIISNHNKPKEETHCSNFSAYSNQGFQNNDECNDSKR